jgi:hypothetical protein
LYPFLIFRHLILLDLFAQYLVKIINYEDPLLHCSTLMCSQLLVLFLRPHRCQLSHTSYTVNIVFTHIDH